MSCKFLLALFLFSGSSGWATNYFIAPNGNDSNAGTSADTPFATLPKAIDLAEPGDTIQLLPGNYPGQYELNGINGAPDLPITIKSFSTDPLDFAVIDPGASPEQFVKNGGFYLDNCSWIVFENLIFRNCWTDVIDCYDSRYITVRSCHFSTGKRPVFPHGNDAHHVLVEHCYAKHPEEVWQGWSWESLHHGTLEYYNGGLMHPRVSGGGHVMRHNTIVNFFNGFRTRPNSIKQDGNIEIYGNQMINIRDNDFEPEDWAWNLHYYHNVHHNIHKAYSIDGVQGGNIYIYGNTYNQSTDDWAEEEVSGIFKYKNGPLTYPCYAFNNSYWTEAKVLKDGEATNHQLKHFNNAYFFYQGSNRFQVTGWQLGYEFDFDLINQAWPSNILNNDQEQNGFPNTNILFADAPNGDFQLLPDSPGKDAGKMMELPEFQWVQRFAGTAPDIGAYEGGNLADGPPFRFIPSPQGAYYEERPRISRHRLDNNLLVLYFSAELDTATVSPGMLGVFSNGNPVTVDSLFFPNHHFEMYIHLTETPAFDSLSIWFSEKPLGTNGLPLTYWASTVPIGASVPHLPDLSIVPIEVLSSTAPVPLYSDAQLSIAPNPASDTCAATLSVESSLLREHAGLLKVYSLSGKLMTGVGVTDLTAGQAIYRFSSTDFPAGVYVATVGVGTRLVSAKFVVE